MQETSNDSQNKKITDALHWMINSSVFKESTGSIMSGFCNISEVIHVCRKGCTAFTVDSQYSMATQVYDFPTVLT